MVAACIGSGLAASTHTRRAIGAREVHPQPSGRGAPLLVVHGGPGAAFHDYFLPCLLPLVRSKRLIFIDERGSGRAQKLEDPGQYTVENMVEDVEAAGSEAWQDSMGHSYGGVLAQAYALKYERNLTHLILCSTFPGTRAMNAVLSRIKQQMTPELRDKINGLEQAGPLRAWPDDEKNRTTARSLPGVKVILSKSARPKLRSCRRWQHGLGSGDVGLGRRVRDRRQPEIGGVC